MGKFNWSAVLHLFTLMTVAAFGRHISGPLAPFLKRQFELTEAEVGLMASAIFLGAITSGIPGGLASDRFNSRILNIMAFSLLAGSFLIVSRINYYSLILLLFALSGISTGLIVPITDRQVVIRFPRNFRLTALGIKQAGSPLGAAAAAMVLPLVALSWGPSGAFLCLAVVTSMGILLTRGLEREEHKAAQTKRMGATLKAIWNRRLLLLGSYGFGIEGLPAITMTFLVLYLVEVLEFPVTLAGLALAITQVSGALARGPLAAIGDHWFRNRLYTFLALICILASITVLLLPFLSNETPPITLFFVSALIGVTNWASFAVTTGVAIEIGGEEHAAAASALVASMARAAVVFWPPIFGTVVVTTGSYHVAWISIVFVILVISLSALFILSSHE